MVYILLYNILCSQVDNEEFETRLKEENRKLKQEMLSKFQKILADNKIFHEYVF